MIKRLYFKITHLIGGYIARFRGRILIEKAVGQLDSFYRKINNVNFDMETNGELRLLKVLSEFKFKEIFDVGANVGEYSILLRKFFPDSRVHAFEIVPSTYEKLSQNVANLENIVAVNHGLGDCQEIIDVYIGKGNKTATAFKIGGFAYHADYYTHTEECVVRKASDYMIENLIDNIDFVKIDTEGMDLRVIKGFEELITKVRVIQFEYGIFNISSHDLLADFCEYFKRMDFVIGKVFPRHVFFFDYHFNHENFHGGNYIAVKSGEKKLIRSLGG